MTVNAKDNLNNFFVLLVKADDFCVTALIGDGRCQNLCNNPQNLYDMGDCCLPNIIEYFCATGYGDCKCHENGIMEIGLEGT